MASPAGVILGKFLATLRDSKCETADDYVKHRDVIAKACETSDALKQLRPRIDEFESFLKDSHDFHVRSDSVVKSALFRAVRLSMGTLSNGVHGNEALKKEGRAYVEALIKYEWHWLIVISMEREPLEDSDGGYDGRGGEGEVIRQDFVLERMQSLKIVRLVLKQAPDTFPLLFARSLVAISENIKDNIRRVSLETLRELCVLNPRMAVASEAFSTLLEAVFDPSFSDMIESIVNTILFMLANPLSRRMLRPHLDLRALIAPFTDVDARESDALPKLTAAKTALMTVMKSWTGMVLLVSDDLGLPTLIRMLRDSKVPVKSQDLLLDAIAEVFEPIFAKVRRSRLNSTSGNGGYEMIVLDDNDDDDGDYCRPTGAAGSIGGPVPPTARTTPTLTGRRRNITIGGNEDEASTSGRTMSPSLINPADLGSGRGTTSKSKRPSFLGALFGVGRASQDKGKDKDKDSDGASTPSQPRRGSGGLFGFDSVRPRRGSGKGQPPSDGAGLTGLGSGQSPSQKSQNGSPASAGASQAATSSARSSSGSDEQYSAQRVDNDKGRSATLDSLTGSSSSAGDVHAVPIVGVDLFADNVLYNLVDNHAAMLCTSLLHSEIVESLCYLGTRGSPHIADKSRVLLVEFLRTLAHILPEQNCAELLNAPSLIEFSTSIHAGGMTNRAHKARQLLSSLADAFSVAPRHFRVSPTGIPERTGLSVLKAKAKSAQLTAEEAGGVNTGSIHSGVSGERVVSTVHGGSKEDGTFYLFQLTGTSDSGANALGQLPLCAVGEHLKHFVDPIARGAIRQGGGGGHGTPDDRKMGLRRVNSRGELVGWAAGDGQGYYDLSRARSGSLGTEVGSRGGQEHLSDVNTSQMEAIRQLRLVSSSTNPHLNDFNKLMEASRVIGKDGTKEPFRWDWAVIYETLEYSFYDNIHRASQGADSVSAKSSDNSSIKSSSSSSSSGGGGGGSHVTFSIKAGGAAGEVENRLQLAMNTKWIRRLSGFYRCSSDGRGYFACLPWDLANLTYFECACSLYHLLTVDPIGQSFLKQDRRGMLFNEMATELKHMVDAVEKQPQKSKFGGLAFTRTFASRAHTDDPLVFRLHSMKTLQAREYFNILGRLVRHPAGQSLMDETDLFRNLSMIGAHPQLDYLSRIVISSLAFNDRGFMSKHLIRIWTSGSPRSQGSQGRSPDAAAAAAGEEREQSRARSASKLSAQPITGRGRGRCSLGLRSYIYNLLGTLLTSRPEDFYSWGLDAVVEMIVWEQPGRVSLHLLRLLLQIVQKCRGLLLLIDKLERVRYHPEECVVSPPSSEDAGFGSPRGSNAKSEGILFADVVTGFDLTTDEAYHPILVYFLALPRGLQYCANGKGPRNGNNKAGSWLADLMADFKAKGAQKYVYDQEMCLARALSLNYVKRELGPQPGLTPIPCLSKDLSSTYTNTVIAPGQVNRESSTIDSIHLHNAAQERAFLVKPVPLGARRPSMARSGATSASGSGSGSGSGSDRGGQGEDLFQRQSSHTVAVESRVRASEAMDLEGMLRIPWNIEVKTTGTPSGTGTGGGSGRVAQTESSTKGDKDAEFLRVDSYLDTSDLSLPSTGGITSDLNRFVKVRGILLGADGFPQGKEIPASSTVHVTLMAGRSPVSRKGQVRGVSAAFSMAQHQQETVAQQSEAENISFALGKEGLMMDGDATEDKLGETPSPVLSAPEDTPITLHLEAMYEWVSCSPQHRLSAANNQNEQVRELGNDRFSVCFPGEPCKFIFSRVRPTAASYEDWRLDGKNNGSSHGATRKDASATASGASQMSGQRASLATTRRRKSISRGDNPAGVVVEPSANPNPGGNGITTSRPQTVYLLEVQYYVTMLTGQALFATQPPHLYGLLARNLPGCSLLDSSSVARDLVKAVQDLTRRTVDALQQEQEQEQGQQAEEEAPAPSSSVHDYSRQCGQLKQALWSLGHIASTDLGYQLIGKASVEVRAQAISERKEARLRARGAALLGAPSSEEGPGGSGGEQAAQAQAQAQAQAPPSPSVPSSGQPALSLAPPGALDLDAAVAVPPAPPSSGNPTGPPAPAAAAASTDEERGGSSSAASTITTHEHEVSDVYEHSSPRQMPPRDVDLTKTKRQRQIHHQEGHGDEDEEGEREWPLFDLVAWCLHHMTAHPHHGVRSTIFGVLGMISRAPLGRMELAKRKWESSVMGCSSAVAVPADHSALFRRNLAEERAFRAYASSIKTAASLPSESRLRASPAIMGSGAIEVLSVLSGMQSLPVAASSGNKLRLEALRKQHAKAFQYRETFMAVQELLGQCRFRLVDRRAINNLFPLKVRLLGAEIGY